MSAATALPLDQQCVLVTGGARGLGRAISLAFLREGARVVVNYHCSESAAQQLQNDFPDQVLAVKADVTQRSQIDALVARAQQHFGEPISTVINNALIGFSFNGDARATLDQMTWPALNQQFEGSIQGALNCVQATLDGMRALRFGRVISIGTNLFQNPVVPYHDYTAAKAALLSLTRTMAHELGPDNITANMVSGGLLRSTDASSATPAEVFEMIAANTPLRRVTTPQEFADAVLFFASPWARSVSGQNLVVDGGLVKD
ncbi:3-oxoacyl-ACP reductase [Carnimonas bestiolae]|uniref:3-oxoacyl-ACP reductase n=1 Tax=Carnimonas bestiolae TaxID=3402172 RepID=UPI003EDC481E